MGCAAAQQHNSATTTPSSFRLQVPVSVEQRASEDVTLRPACAVSKKSGLGFSQPREVALVPRESQRTAGRKGVGCSFPGAHGDQRGNPEGRSVIQDQKGSSLIISISATIVLVSIKPVPA
ncbi:hypothetical protein O3P69_003311 [Scylla paramamosain]|uniref:Uncharacterized protein n=1 Tax=Scylla paramamosain TaxID=85552 RepID=A0AAW0ULK5_SCYPA